MNKEIRVAFINTDLKEAFDKLKEGKFEDKQLHKFIMRAINDLKQHPDCGVRISKNLA